jgi:hypothetical protein
VVVIGYLAYRYSSRGERRDDVARFAAQI